MVYDFKTWQECFFNRYAVFVLKGACEHSLIEEKSFLERFEVLS